MVSLSLCSGVCYSVDFALALGLLFFPLLLLVPIVLRMLHRLRFDLLEISIGAPNFRISFFGFAHGFYVA